MLSCSLPRIGILQSDAYDAYGHCNVLGDLDHIFFRCSKFTNENNELYSDITMLKIETPFNLIYLLSVQNKNIIN